MKVTLAVRSFGPATFFSLVFVSTLASLAFPLLCLTYCSESRRGAGRRQQARALWVRIPLLTTGEPPLLPPFEDVGTGRCAGRNSDLPAHPHYDSSRARTSVLLAAADSRRRIRHP